VDVANEFRAQPLKTAITRARCRNSAHGAPGIYTRLLTGELTTADLVLTVELAPMRGLR
jgi:hypothetical protein